MQILIYVTTALLAGLLLSRIVKPFKFPDVTAYLVAGVLIGPFCLGRLGIPVLGFNSIESVKSLSLISDVALGFIAFSIGDEFRLEQLKTTGKQATFIGIFQAIAACLMVDIVLVGLHFIMPDKMSLEAAITLGAIATATAPAATLMVVRQYKAKGPLTNLLLPIVALDDAVGLVVFSVSFGIAKALVSGRVSVLSIIVEPLLEIVLSLVLGSVLGLIFSACEKYVDDGSKRLSMSIAFVLMAVAISMCEFEVGGIHIGFSSLLTCMMMGTIFCNVREFSSEIMDRSERWTKTLFVLFFVLSGAELDFSVFADVAVIGIGILYILARSLGKYFGAGISARVVHCEPQICKYLGITLLPQAGVALGMSVQAETLGAEGAMIRSIVLFGILVYELVGPMMTKDALEKAGEIPLY